jgi:hypothetical protein
MHSACHVIGCHATEETRVQNAYDDMASTNHESLSAGRHVTTSKSEPFNGLFKARPVTLDPRLTPG